MYESGFFFLNIQIYQDLDRYVCNLFIFFILVMNNSYFFRKGKITTLTTM